MVFSMNANEDSFRKFAAFQAQAMRKTTILSTSSAVVAWTGSSTNTLGFYYNKPVLPTSQSSTSNTSPTSNTSTANGSTTSSAVSSTASSTGSPSSAARTSSPSSSNITPSLVDAKTKVGPIAGGVVGGLALLAVLGFLLHWAHRRRQNSINIEATRYDWTPMFGSLPTGKTLSSSPEQAVPRGRMSADPEKARFEEAEQMGTIQQELRELRQQAVSPTASLTPAGSAGSLTGEPDPTNAQLLDAVRTLNDEMHMLKQQMRVMNQAEEPRQTPRTLY
ncbi:hypothetical protein MVEN_02033300 [Mycena venus]|uniref:Mid2 domain-containing protein n=1 Tax=Mycena venus TaxID=2733690 RepID=A0A8H6XB88_9AGAR|nr:hypothetical protein MVEN_02033300 [Mycena venus]